MVVNWQPPGNGPVLPWPLLRTCLSKRIIKLQAGLERFQQAKTLTQLQTLTFVPNKKSHCQYCTLSANIVFIVSHDGFWICGWLSQSKDDEENRDIHWRVGNIHNLYWELVQWWCGWRVHSRVRPSFSQFVPAAYPISYPMIITRYCIHFLKSRSISCLRVPYIICSFSQVRGQVASGLQWCENQVRASFQKGKYLYMDIDQIA